MALFTEAELMDELMEAASGGFPAGGSATGNPWAGDAPAGSCASPAARWAAIEERRAVRAFSPDPVPDEALRAVLGSGSGAGLHRALAIAGGTSPGLYLAEAECAARRIADESTVLRLRGQYAPAPILLLYFGTPADVRDHYRLLREAGTAGYGAWLTGVGHGLAGCPFGRSSGFATEAIRAAGHPSTRHLFTVALGRPAGTDEGGAA